MEQKQLGSPDLSHIYFPMSFGLFLSAEPMLTVAARVLSKGACLCICARGDSPVCDSMWAAARPALSSSRGLLARVLWLLLEG